LDIRRTFFSWLFGRFFNLRLLGRFFDLRLLGRLLYGWRFGLNGWLTSDQDHAQRDEKTYEQKGSTFHFFSSVTIFVRILVI
jgi:hypothetical protein